MPEAIRFDETLTFRCSAALPRLVKRAAVRRGCKEAQWLRDAVGAALRAEGFDPTVEQEFALVANGELVQGRHGAISTFRPGPDDRGEWIPTENVDSQQFDAKLHYRMHPYPLRIEGGRVIREYPVVLKSELGE